MRDEPAFKGDSAAKQPGRKAERYWQLRSEAAEALLAVHGLPSSAVATDIARRVSVSE